MFSRLIQFLGLLVIVFFSAFCIFYSIMEREMPDGSYTKKIGSIAKLFESRFYDARMSYHLKEDAVDDRLVLAAIDDHSINEVGTWPFPRTVWSQFMTKMNSFGASVVAFDVFFSEKALSCPGENPDVEFAHSISDFQSREGQKVIIPYSLTKYDNDAFSDMPDIMFNFMINDRMTEGVGLIPQKVEKKVFPIEILRDTGLGLASIGSVTDPDGVYREYPVVSNVDFIYLPSYALSAYRYYTGDDPTLYIDSNQSIKLKMATGDLSINKNGETKVRWFGGESNFPAVGISDIIKADGNDPQMLKTFKDKIVFVGSTAFGAHDLRHTPIHPKLPGVYYHMNMTKMLLDGNFYKDEESIGYSWGMLFVGSFLLIIFMLFNNPMIDLFAVVTISLGLFFLDLLYLVPQGYDTKLFFCLFSVVACYSWSTFLNFYSTAKEKQKIRGTFSSFVAPAIVDQMLANPELVKVGGERKNITVFFSDVRDFTSISEKLTPEELSICLNQYMGVMTDIIFDSYGTLDKYIGDAIVAYWGAPVALENHPYHALKAAIRMIEALPKVNERFKEQGFPELEHGIGLNTGDCSVGNMGSDKIFSYTALGDQMNLGARIESLCKFYGVELNVSENTLNALPENMRAEFKYRMLDKVRVKGKELPITIYEVFHSTHPFALDEEAHQKYNKAFELYLAQKFQEAMELFASLAQKFPKDKSSSRMLKVCQEFIEFPPPPDWDGVFTHTTKG